MLLFDIRAVLYGSTTMRCDVECFPADLRYIQQEGGLCVIGELSSIASINDTSIIL